ncbi:MAG: hypothetical protein N2747_04720 [Chitinophagaceae bacterium]|nr:hypothetical protein [Chitinophagaceae bacterium]
MKKFILFLLPVFLFSCKDKNKSSSGGDNTPVQNNRQPGVQPAPSAEPATTHSSVNYTVDGVEITNYASLLVTKDEDKLQPGTPYLCILTSNNAKNNNESFLIKFLLNTKPGTYPVVGMSFMRGKGDNEEVFGGMLGGKSKITDYKMNITECKDLGDNGYGGHKWSISGTCDVVKIKAAGFMLMDKTKKHPEEVTIEKISFRNLTFDDNIEERMEKIFKK